jgi:seryl-tRNA synthetase
MEQKLQILTIISAFLVGFAAGGGLVKFFWQRENLAEITALQEQTRQALENAEKQKCEAAEVQSDLLARLATADSSNRDRLRDIERLRSQLQSVPTAASDTIRTCEKRFAECRNLLAEGIDLSEEGRALAERIAIKKDGLAKLAQ